MTRGGRKKRREIVERKCIATSEVKPTSEMVRFVVGPEAQIYPDLSGKLPGRGIWVTSNQSTLQRAVEKGLFSRAAKQKVSVPDGLISSVSRGLRSRLIETVSLARKAGLAIAGYEKVKSAIQADSVAALLQASDGSDRGKAKLRPSEADFAFIGCLTADELGLSFGRDHVIHAALASGGLAVRAVEDAEKLAGLLPLGETSKVGDHPGKD